MSRVLSAFFPGTNLVLGVCDAFLVSGTLALAALVTFGNDSRLFFTYYAGTAKIVIAASLFLLSAYYAGLFEDKNFTNRWEAWNGLIQSLGLWILTLAVLNYAHPMLIPPLRVIVLGASMATPLLIAWHRIFLAAINRRRLTDRAVVIGSGEWATDLAHEVEGRPGLGIHLMGYVDPRGPVSSNGLKYFGTPNQLPEVIKANGINQIVVAMAERRGFLPVNQLLALKKTGVQVLDGADLYESAMGKVPVQWLKASWLLFSPGFCISRTTRIYKRLASIAGAALGLIIAGPFMLLTAIAIILDSPGPALLRQERVGEDGRVFNLFKFRTMYAGNEKDRSFAPAQKQDRRVTRVGKWLRRTRLDELPQLYNILRGDMHFIGPRPFVPWQENVLVDQIPFYNQRWTIKPGATGWAQVNRPYCVTVQDNIEKLAYDLFYIKNLSLALDLLILVKTTKILLLGRGGQ
ncbi:MAG TPA: exopolysaccharide biosynthesis polyprenyl glycosylphosphotransferase [Terriglobia bacterium]|nr:exopolysaccharide biosynthesis polyprenyl glycosylphosphotransferase [Terriglobia bacterium]